MYASSIVYSDVTVLCCRIESHSEPKLNLLPLQPVNGFGINAKIRIIAAFDMLAQCME